MGRFTCSPYRWLCPRHLRRSLKKSETVCLRKSRFRWRAEARSKKGKSACVVYLPDLEQLRPPDVPLGMVKLRLVKKA